MAGADPALWAAIFHENRTPLLHAIDQFEGQLAAFRRALQGDDLGALVDWWETGRGRRAQFRFDRVAAPKPPNPPAEAD
ncbi:MAG: prephenate dehydrogenase dimerization domain-containing protein [Isosphaeraceae bacterium]